MSPARSRFVVALIAAGCAMAGPAAADDDTAAVIADLKRRIEALEQQLAARPPAEASASAAPAAAAAPAVTASNGNGGDFKLAWGGYVKADAIISRYSDGPVAQGLGRDAFVPNSIAVAAPGAGNARTYNDLHAKETRLYLKGSGTVLGHKVGVNTEIDFIAGQLTQTLAGAPNEAVTNAYNPAFRLGYIDFDNFRIGQDWTTMQNMVALPDIIDLINWPSEGTVFGRQTMIRYTWGGLQLALENGETTVAQSGGNTFGVTNDNALPDFVWRYNYKTAHWGDYSLAGVARQLTDRGFVPGSNDSSLGWGLSLAGKIPLWGQDDLRFTVSGGDGIGRYLALNSVGDAVIDPAGKLHAIEIINGFLAWRHPWNDQWRSNLALSAYRANVGETGEGTLLGSGVTRIVRSVTANLLYSPIPKITFGAEYRYARRDTVGNLSGDMSRLQFSARYNF
ncbi:DcaP family trimeric outer membrane transporter [Nevskia sp.]|uniref:DcaP family trimeric outer membrane transporter n=1 Tax=Nevskia sp. TaxID=1929292 RepID=UPI003F717C65